jgi:hypothetical protein
MSYNCKIVADSVAENDCRLTTFEITFPRMILAEWNTHRVFSRNTASSRAIPVEKLMKSIQESPFIPERFPKNKPGMASTEWLDGEDHIAAEAQWLYARDQALNFAQNLETLQVHKQVANRLLEPFMWVTSVTSSTEWNNFFTLRVNKDLADTVETWEEYKIVEDANMRDGRPFPAQPEIQRVAFEMRRAYLASKPNLLKMGEWHLPYVTEEEKKEFSSQDRLYLSAGRCGKVSFLTHGESNNPQRDIEIARDKMVANKHWSPVEHPATPLIKPNFLGNFRGWKQFRKNFEGESGE